MLNETQLTEIRSYLLTKRLPIDILLEVNDHFITQSSDLMKEENLSFEDSFEKTKTSWRKELKPYWNGSISLEDVSDFMRRVRKENEISNLKFALKCAVPYLLLIFAGLIFLNAKFFGIFTLAVLLVIVTGTLINYFMNYQDFKLVKKYQNYVLTWHQHSVIVFIVFISPMMQILDKLSDTPAKYRDYLLLKGNITEFLFTLLPILVLIFGAFYSYSSQKNYLRQIQKVKPFLKYLKASS